MEGTIVFLIAVAVAAESAACVPATPSGTNRPGLEHAPAATSPVAVGAPGLPAETSAPAAPAGDAPGDSTVAVAAPTGAIPAAPPASAIPDRWWCMSFLHKDIGFCHRTQQGCETAHRRMAIDKVSECAPQDAAICFDAKDASGKAIRLCHPTFATCRAHIDNRDVQAVSGCRALSLSWAPARDASIDEQEAAHWWCVTFAGQTLGACERSLRGCNVDRDLAIQRRSNPNDAVSACAPQRSAICLRYRDAKGVTNRQCHPTLAMCKNNIEFYRANGLPGAQVLTDCHAVD